MSLLKEKVGLTKFTMTFKKSKVAYIGGKVCGLPFDEVFHKFGKKQVELEAQGYKVHNPVSLIKAYNRKLEERGEPPLTDENNRKQIMRLCILYLLNSDELHLLQDWKDSAGAQDERTNALKYGIDIVYPNGIEPNGILCPNQIDYIFDWLNGWEQLKNTAIPIRFKEEFTKPF